MNPEAKEPDDGEFHLENLKFVVPGGCEERCKWPHATAAGDEGSPGLPDLEAAPPADISGGGEEAP